jgi:iron complex outermembrane receptor protein
VTSVHTRSLVRIGTPLARAVASTLAFAAAAPAAWSQQATTGGLEVVVVTATRREANLQTIPVAVTAITGQALADNKLFSAESLANAAPSFSFTAYSPLDQELNMRGITNTRLDSATADPSVGTFVDGIYIGRTGDYNFDFYDLERVEIIRGPQGVLLGKNVVGGAVSVITAAPSQRTSSEVTASYGNYNAILLGGHANGGLTDTLAGRLAFQYRTHDGYAEDILHHRDLEDLDSKQLRGQLLWEPGDGWRVRGIFDYTDDDSNGMNAVAVEGGTESCETSYLSTNCTRPWSNLRAYLGLTDPRKSMPQGVTLKDTPRQQQFLTRTGHGATLDIARQWSWATFNSLTGYRSAKTRQLFDQPGIGVDALDYSVPAWLAYSAYVDARYGDRPPLSNQGAALFELATGEQTDADSISQEFRLTSNTDGRFNWIVGAYYKHDNVNKKDQFFGENFFGAFADNQPIPNFLSVTSGENNWFDDAKLNNYAIFGQLGFKFTDTLRLNVGLRQTWDKKKGTSRGVVVATGDRFNPNDPIAIVTLVTVCRSPAGDVVPVPDGEQCLAPNAWAQGNYQVAYSADWNELTPQATLDWRITGDLYTYLTYSAGFKGGGFDGRPASALQASTPYDPEKAKNYEVGIKWMTWDRRLRINADVFYMDYTDLQVEQLNDDCLCTFIENAASAEIKGVEAEFELAPVKNLRLTLSGSYVDATYKDFIESSIDPTTGLNLDSTGNRLQRTPETQLSAGIGYRIGMADFNLNYSWQSDLFWATDNIAKEPSYGLLDGRIAFGPEDRAWSVAVWGKNLTDELYRVNIIPFAGEEISQFGAPRTYGVDVTLRF